MVPKAVLFDLSEVLLVGLKGFDERLSSVIDAPREEISSALLGDHLTDFFLGKTSERKYFETVLEWRHWGISPSDLEWLVRNHFSEIPGTRDIIRQVRERSFPTALLSVHAAPWISHCEESFPFEHLFDSVHYSFSSGLLKPDPKAFASAVFGFGIPMGEIAFVDDDPKNLSAARKLWMTAVRFTDAETLRNDFKKLRIL